MGGSFNYIIANSDCGLEAGAHHLFSDAYSQMVQVNFWKLHDIKKRNPPKLDSIYIYIYHILFASGLFTWPLGFLKVFETHQFRVALICPDDAMFRLSTFWCDNHVFAR